MCPFYLSDQVALENIYQYKFQTDRLIKAIPVEKLRLASSCFNSLKRDNVDRAPETPMKTNTPVSETEILQNNCFDITRARRKTCPSVLRVLHDYHVRIKEPV